MGGTGQRTSTVPIVSAYSSLAYTSWSVCLSVYGTGWRQKVGYMYASEKSDPRIDWLQGN